MLNKTLVLLNIAEYIYSGTYDSDKLTEMLRKQNLIYRTVYILQSLMLWHGFYVYEKIHHSRLFVNAHSDSSMKTHPAASMTMPQFAHELHN